MVALILARFSEYLFEPMLSISNGLALALSIACWIFCLFAISSLLAASFLSYSTLTHFSESLLILSFKAVCTVFFNYFIIVITHHSYPSLFVGAVFVHFRLVFLLLALSFKFLSATLHGKSHTLCARWVLGIFIFTTSGLCLKLLHQSLLHFVYRLHAWILLI